MRKKLLFTIFILASAGSLYGQGWTFNDGTLNVTSQIWVQSYEFGNTHPSTYNKTPYSDYHSQIKTIILADNITYVGERAFAQCSVAERLVVGKGVKKFAYSAFHFPKSTLKTIEWNAANASIITQYQYSVIQYSYEGPFGRKETYVDVVDRNYAANAETIIFGPEVTSIPNYFAYFMKKLKKVEFGAKVTSIGIQAFVGIIPNTVLIARMPNPASVTLGNGNTYYNPFPASASDRNKITLKVPAAYVNKYKAANIWKDFKIVAIETATIDVVPDDVQNGSVTGGGTFETGTNIQISANPADCYQFTQWSDGNTHNPRTITVTGDATYTAEFSKIQYAVQFNNYDGTPLQNTNVDCGTLPSYNGENPTKPADAQYTYTFSGWTPEVVAATGDATYTATFTAVPVPLPDSIFVHDGEDPNMCDLAAHSLSHVIIEPGGELNVDLSCVHVDVVTIISTGIHSGQIHHGSNPIPTNHMFMEYVLNPLGTSASPNLWYAFAVPFEVDIETGITRAYGSTSHISGTDFLIKEYDGNLRATTGKGWKSKMTGTLEPGHFYMIGIEGTCNRWLFEKKSEAAVEGDKHMQVKTYIANKAEYNNWNGLGNTRLEYSTMDLSGLGIEYILTYNSQFDKYDISLVSASTLCVGRPFFVQAISAGEFDFVHSSGSNNMPALYAQRGTKPLMQFTLTDETQSTGIDNMFLTMHKDADGTYTLGRDVARMSKNCKTAAQLWCTMPDGTELSAHGVAMPETETIVPITLFAPNEGSYFLNASTNAMDGYDIELLQNGAQIAIFSDAQPIKLDLNAGTNSGYSLRISRRDMPEGIEDVQREEIQSTKVIINDHLYILRAGHMYDAQGKQVK